jgi:hypothetical protein
LTDSPTAIGTRGKLGTADQSAALDARSKHRRTEAIDAWRMCATHRTLHMTVSSELS